MPSLTLTAILVSLVGVQDNGRTLAVPTDPKFATTWDKVNFSHELWNGVLSDHVNKGGLVDYAAVKQDKRFAEYLFRLANTDPGKLTDDRARKAFWINAYNALVFQGVLATRPSDENAWAWQNVIQVQVPGITQQGKGFFLGLFFTVGGQHYNLDLIEKGVLLQWPQFTELVPELIARVGVQTPDPRVHFALVCGAKGCPPLRQEAYEAGKIDEQLSGAVRTFMKRKRWVVIKRKKRVLQVSQLLQWYGKDLLNPNHSPHADSIPEFLANYVDDAALAKSLLTEEWTVRWKGYDWSLNIQP